MAAATALPTMTNPNCAQEDRSPSVAPEDTIGLFEGAHYFHCGAYRPDFDCKMKRIGVRFCEVCADVIRRRVGPAPT